MNSFLILVLFALLIAAPFASLNLASAATFTINPTSGPPGTAITARGLGFPASAEGIMWFDSDRNGFFEDRPREPFSETTSNSEGAFLVGPLRAPRVPTGTYSVLIDLPRNGFADAGASFTIIPIIRLQPLSGPSGTEIRVILEGFPASSSGIVWFDTNNNGIRNIGEPKMAGTTDDTGTTYLTLIAPTTAVGNYKIRADLPAGSPVEASRTFTVTPKIILNPTNGSPGQVVNVQGSKFVASSSGRIWFDTDKDGVKDTGETSVNVVTSSSRTFTADITVPTVPRGTYPIKAEVPIDAAIKASADFTVKPKLVLTSSYKNQIQIQVDGSGYDASRPGFVWFDTDGDSIKETGEPSAAVTTSSLGTFSASLFVQVAQGTYQVRTLLGLGSNEPSATFVATPHIFFQPSSGPKGTVVSVYGNGFEGSSLFKTVTGFVWFDTDNDNIREKGEPAVKAETSKQGFFKVGLTVPVGVPGNYKIRADVPSGGIVEASRTFSLTL